MGETPLDRARGEMLLDAFQDVLTPFLTKYFPEKDETKKVLDLELAACQNTQLN